VVVVVVVEAAAAAVVVVIFLLFGAKINDLVITVMNFLYHEICCIFY